MTQNRPDSWTSESEAAMRGLTTRLLTLPELYDARSSEPTRLFVGALPDDLPGEVPIPNDATIVGGLVRNLSPRQRAAEVVIDVEISAEQFRDSYRQLLLDTGWTEDGDWPEKRGFVPRDLPLLLRYASRSPRLMRRLGFDTLELLPRFRLGVRGLVLRVVARNRRNAPTDVRLTLLPGRHGLRPRYDTAWKVIPSLYPLPEAIGQTEARGGVLAPPRNSRTPGGSHSGSGGYRENDGAYSYTALEIDLGLPTVADHYATQLERTGWTRTDEGSSGPQAWSTWTFKDEKNRSWTGTFTALRLPNTPTRYFLQIHAGREPRH